MILFVLLSSAALHTAAAAPLSTGSAQPPTSPQVFGPLSFDGAKLGMPVDAWEALRPPPGVGPTAAADCGSQIVAALRADRIAASMPRAGQTTCAYDARFGDEVVLHSVRLDARYRLDDLRYRFTGGRLGEIDFTASIDAYDDLVGMLTHRYGAPTTTARDVMRVPAGSFPRVRQTWHAPGAVVSLTDPTDDPLRLTVRISGAPKG